MSETIVTSRPLPLLEGGYAGKTPVTQGDNDQGQAIAFQGAEQLTLSPSQGDPYLLAEQLLSQNQALLPSSDSNSYAREFFRSISTDAEEIQDDSRQLHRDLQQSSDLYNKANTNSAARAASTPGKPKKLPHIEALENMISTIHDDYQNTYSEINKKAAEFMRDVNTVLGKISDHIGAGSDGRIIFGVQAFLKNFAKEFSKYITPTLSGTESIAAHIDKQSVSYFINWDPDKNHSATPIYTFSGNIDAATRDFWQKKLGDGFIVKEGADKKIGVFPNLTPIKEIYSSLGRAPVGWPAGSSITSQSFQTLQSSIDSQKNAVNSSVSQLLERFRQDNSTFETMIQLLTKMTEDLHRYNAGYMQ